MYTRNNFANYVDQTSYAVHILGNRVSNLSVRLSVMLFFYSRYLLA